MSDGGADRYELIISPSARRRLAETLPEAVAFAAHELIVGALLLNPHRLGKRLQPPLQDRHSARRGTYRVIYRIDDEQMTVTVLDVVHRQDAYRTTRPWRRAAHRASAARCASPSTPLRRPRAPRRATALG